MKSLRGDSFTSPLKKGVRLKSSRWTHLALYPFFAMGPLASDLERAGITIFRPEPVVASLPKVESLSGPDRKPITLRSTPQRFIGGVRFLNGGDMMITTTAGKATGMISTLSSGMRAIIRQ